jgi:hypothetical protein
MKSSSQISYIFPVLMLALCYIWPYSLNRKLCCMALNRISHQENSLGLLIDIE